MDREDWLAQVEEEILDPDLPICDPHHHLWDFPTSRYLLDELLADIGTGGAGVGGEPRRGHNVVSTVFVECTSMYRATGPHALKPVGETEFVNGVAAMCASGTYGDIRACAAIVGFADCTLGTAVGDVLDAHASASPRFRGIRHASGWDADEAVRNSHTNPTEGLLGAARFREGFAEIGRRGLTFDAWLYHHQIPELTELARAFPDQPIVLDHFGGPLGIGPYAGRRKEIYESWRVAVDELAKCENVVAKLGGLVMPVNDFGFHKRDRPATSNELIEATRDYYMHAIECFGTRRCMFESNFPVDRQSCSYAVLWNSFKRLTEGFSAAEKADLFHDTAVRVYRVE